MNYFVTLTTGQNFKVNADDVDFKSAWIYFYKNKKAVAMAQAGLVATVTTDSCELFIA